MLASVMAKKFAVGADLVVIDLASTHAIEQATRRAETIWQQLFPTIMMGDDRAIREVWVGGIKRG